MGELNYALFFVTENPFHFIMSLAFYICSALLPQETYYFNQWFAIIFICKSTVYARARGQRDKSALQDYDTSHLQNYVLPLLWQVHLKPISPSTDDDGDDMEQITKAL